MITVPVGCGAKGEVAWINAGATDLGNPLIMRIVTQKFPDVPGKSHLGVRCESDLLPIPQTSQYYPIVLSRNPIPTPNKKSKKKTKKESR